MFSLFFLLHLLLKNVAKYSYYCFTARDSLTRKTQAGVSTSAGLLFFCFLISCHCLFIYLFIYSFINSFKHFLLFICCILSLLLLHGLQPVTAGVSSESSAFIRLFNLILFPFGVILMYLACKTLNPKP